MSKSLLHPANISCYKAVYLFFSCFHLSKQCLQSINIFFYCLTQGHKCLSSVVSDTHTSIFSPSLRAHRWHSMVAVWHIRFPSGPHLPYCWGERHGGWPGWLRGGEEGCTGEQMIVWKWPWPSWLYWVSLTTLLCHSYGCTVLLCVSILQYCTVSQNQESCTCCLNKPTFTLQPGVNPLLFD